jgi:SNF2 family DNA or RNA helicase
MIECFPDIKEPIETIIPVDLNKTQQKMYDEIATYLQTLDQQGEPLHSPTVLSMLNRLRQISVATPEVKGDYYDPKLERRVFDVELVEPSSKLDAFMEILDGMEWDKDKKDQVVVFSNFNDPLKMLEERLKRAKIPYLRLLPKMNDMQRMELWKDVWPTKQHRVFLTTIRLGGESINLTSANRAVFLDQDWSPAANNQAIGRIYRPGQTEVAQIIYIRANGTVDFRVLDTVTEKTGWFKQIFGVTDDD